MYRLWHHARLGSKSQYTIITVIKMSLCNVLVSIHIHCLKRVCTDELVSAPASSLGANPPPNAGHVAFFSFLEKSHKKNYPQTKINFWDRGCGGLLASPPPHPLDPPNGGNLLHPPNAPEYSPLSSVTSVVPTWAHMSQIIWHLNISKKCKLNWQRHHIIVYTFPFLTVLDRVETSFFKLGSEVKKRPAERICKHLMNVCLKYF